MRQGAECQLGIRAHKRLVVCSHQRIVFIVIVQVVFTGITAFAAIHLLFTVGSVFYVFDARAQLIKCRASASAGEAAEARAQGHS